MRKTKLVIIVFSIVLYQDYGHADPATTLEKECIEKNAVSCGLLGELYFSEMSEKSNTNKSVHWLTKACHYNDATGCFNLGLILDKNAVSPKDKANQKNAYIRACKSGLPEACNNYAVLIARDTPEKTAKIWRRACKGGSPHACANGNVGKQSGTYLIDNKFKVRLVRRDNCTSWDLVRCVETNHPVRVAKKRPIDNVGSAKSILEFACDKNIALACRNSGEIYNSRNNEFYDRNKALALFEKACKLDDKRACSLASKLKK